VVLLVESTAGADEAQVTVGRIDDARFSEPPPRDVSAPIARDDDPFHSELHRSPVRLQLGPAGITTGKGFGLGVGTALDIGTGTVGARLAAAWLRGEAPSVDGVSRSPLGDALGHYTGEVTLDLHQRGPLHPVLGMGVGLIHVSRPEGGGFAGIGTGRAGLDYSLGLEDADVRVGASVTGILTGPQDDELKDLRGYALVQATLSIGF
jgi:hypothetical protein